MPTEARTDDHAETERQGRTVRMIHRWTPAEREALTARAKAAGVSVSAYVRAAALEGEAPAPKRRRSSETRPRLDPAEFRQLVAIGNNLNQIARALNAERPDLIGGDLGEALAELRGIWGRFL